MRRRRDTPRGPDSRPTFREQDMMPISDIQVSFDVHSADGATLVVPYVIAAEDVKLAYDLKVVEIGPFGRLNTSQSGSLAMHAGERSAVATLVMNPQKGDSCNARLTLSQAGGEVRTFTADCGMK
jgi:hypothetical protein